VAEELGIPRRARAGWRRVDTRIPRPTAWTYASRFDADLGRGAAAMAARKIRDKRGSSPASAWSERADLEWEPGNSPSRAHRESKTIQECAFRRPTQPSSRHEAASGDRTTTTGLTFTSPSGSYICVVDIDPRHGATSRCARFVANPNELRNIINPMIVQGQVHGGLNQGLARRCTRRISYDEEGNISAGASSTITCPRPMESPAWENRATRHALAAPSAARRPGRVGRRSARRPRSTMRFVDALAHLGVSHFTSRSHPKEGWQVLEAKGVAE